MSTKNPRDVILRPVVSEKSYALNDQGVYPFVVAHDAAGNASATSPVLTFSSGEIPDAGCEVKFDVSKACVQDRLSDQDRMS